MNVFRDLAVDLRLKLGDWFRVVQLLKTGGGGGRYTRVYIEDVSRWREDMNFMFEWQKQYDGIDILVREDMENTLPRSWMYSPIFASIY